MSSPPTRSPCAPQRHQSRTRILTPDTQSYAPEVKNGTQGCTPGLDAENSVTTTASCGTQTDDKLLEYIAELEDALKTARKEISQLHDRIDLVQEYKDVLQKERSKYRNLWMTERRYSHQLEDAGAEAYGGFGQARSSESSSPYYRCDPPVFDFQDISSP